MVDVGGVVDPLVAVIVMRRITDDDQMIAGHVLQPVGDVRASPERLIAPAGDAMGILHVLVEAYGNAEQGECDDLSRETDTDRAAAALPGSKMADSLKKDDEKDAEGRSGVVGLKPGDDDQAQNTDEKMPKRRTNAAVLKKGR